jgi:hypothetical protein
MPNFPAQYCTTASGGVSLLPDAWIAGATTSPAGTVAIDGKPKMSIVLAEGAIPSERTASEELAHYHAGPARRAEVSLP